MRVVSWDLLYRPELEYFVDEDVCERTNGGGGGVAILESLLVSHRYFEYILKVN